ncbi:hypothetical protein T492DRAFT_510302 [Pavlovales sp. CCMP2436]|nr:hypothetical protein T492DRAFT_510302 [Pavlovales sp. CCMP2436]
MYLYKNTSFPGISPRTPVVRTVRTGSREPSPSQIRSPPSLLTSPPFPPLAIRTLTPPPPFAIRTGQVPFFTDEGGVEVFESGTRFLNNSSFTVP